MMKLENYRIAIAAAAIVAAAAAGAEEAVAQQDEAASIGNWRISAGGIYASPVKARFHFMPVRVVAPSSGMSSSKAKALAEGNVTRFTKESPDEYVEFPNGTIINPWDDTRRNNELWGIDSYGTTRNAWFPASALDGNHFNVATYKYQDVSGGSIGVIDYSDDECLWGANLELSRNLYRNEEKKYGFDVAFGASYFFKEEICDVNVQYASYNVNSGSQNTVIDVSGSLGDTRSWLDGGFGGAKSGVDAAVFNLSDMGVRGKGKHSSITAAMWANGDYNQLDLMLLGKPYYDICEWLRIVGTVGVVVSRCEFSLDTRFVGTGLNESHSKDFVDWDVSGIGGLGLQFSYDDWSLGVDFLARFLDDDLEIKDTYVRGEIEQSPWMVKASLGYRF